MKAPGGEALQNAIPAISITVFVIFALTFLKERLAWSYFVAFVFLGMAAYFAFAFKSTSLSAD